MLQIMGFVAAPVAAGVRLSYTLNAPAAVDVTIRNLAGRVVKRVLTSRETPAGDAGVVWTGQADNGLAAPNGTYVVEIVARSPENGERTGLLRSVQLRR
jgi:flagellar hook assembly protein FlgD